MDLKKGKTDLWLTAGANLLEVDKYAIAEYACVIECL